MFASGLQVTRMKCVLRRSSFTLPPRIGRRPYSKMTHDSSVVGEEPSKSPIHEALDRAREEAKRSTEEAERRAKIEADP